MWKNEDDTCCGNCKYHRCIDGEWVCGCSESIYYEDYTDYADGEECSDFEER